MKILRSAVGSLVSLGLIKELWRHDVEVIGMDMSPNNFNSVNLERFYVVPRPSSKNFIPTILEIIKKEKPNALLPGPDNEIE